jgi:hypothetical protein
MTIIITDPSADFSNAGLGVLSDYERVPSSGLVAEYRAEDANLTSTAINFLVDRTGITGNATVTAATKPTIVTSGGLQHAATLSSVSNWFDVPYSLDNAAITLMAVSARRASGAASAHAIAGGRSGNTGLALSTANNGVLHLQYGNGSSFVTPTSIAWGQDTAFRVAGFTFNPATNAARLFSQSQTVDITTTAFVPTGLVNFRIGNTYANLFGQVNTDLRRLWIWNRVLTVAETEKVIAFAQAELGAV